MSLCGPRHSKQPVIDDVRVVVAPFVLLLSPSTVSSTTPLLLGARSKVCDDPKYRKDPADYTRVATYLFCD